MTDFQKSNLCPDFCLENLNSIYLKVLLSEHPWIGQFDEFVWPKWRPTFRKFLTTIIMASPQY